MKPLLILLTLSTALLAQKPLTIEAITAEGGITGRPPETFQWSPDSSRLSYVQRDDTGEHGELWSIDAATGQKSVLVSEVTLSRLAPPLSKIQDEREKERLTRYGVAAYQWAPDSQHILFDSHGQLWLFRLDNGTAVQFTSSPDPSSDPKFSPDGKFVSFIREHSLVIEAVEGLKEGGMSMHKKRDKHETAADQDQILNGEVDWVYEEELGVRSNQFWSPDSRKIVFLQMDEAPVPTYPITDWMPTHPRVEKEKYPKVGDPNPTVRLGVLDAGNQKAKWITPFAESDAPGVYIPRFGWVNPGVVWAQVLNRRQDQIDLYFIDVNSGHVRNVLSEKSDAWINVNDDFRILKSGDNGPHRFLWTSWRDGHTQIYLYSFNPADPTSPEAKLEMQLTQGDFEVVSVDGVAEAPTDAASTVSFIATTDDSREQHIFSVHLNGSSLHQLLPGPRSDRAEFAEDGKHFAFSLSTALHPSSWAMCSLDGTCKPIWQPRSLANYGLTTPTRLDFKAEDGTPLHGWLMLPANATGRIPLLVYVYGGPAGQTAADSWDGFISLFHQYLVQHGFAVFTVDNRGTPNRDKRFMAAIQGQFGAVELRDQLSSLNSLLTQYPQLDKDRMAIWGWSNGGSMTLYAMTHAQVFRAGISVAPVTDQRDYDSIYTERYLGLLPEAAKAYDDTSEPKRAADLHGSLLLVHGTSDDNVHFQNTIQMIDALVKAGKQFDLMLYPNKTHGISGIVCRLHLFTMIEDHFERELK